MPTISFKRSLVRIALFVGIFLIHSSNAILGQTQEGRQLVVAELISDAVSTKEPFTVGIRFAIQPDWYLYWKNPGDAGLPIEVKWDLPSGWTAEEVRFPIPSKFVHDDITAYGYKNEVVLLAKIIPDKSTHGPLQAQLDWLVCRESCLRGGMSVSLDISKQTRESRAGAAALLKAYHSKLPGTQEESKVLLRNAHITQDGEKWILHAPLGGPKANDVRDFFPDVTDGVIVEFQRIGVHQNELTVVFTRQKETLRFLALKGLLVTKDAAYEVAIPIQFPSQ